MKDIYDDNQTFAVEQILSLNNENKIVSIVCNPFCNELLPSIENFAHQFIQNNDNNDYTILQSMIAPGTYTVNNKIVEKGKWVLELQILDTDLWEKFKNSKLLV